MNVLIIGGTGILSKAVVDECVANNYNVTMVNRGRRTLFLNDKVTLIKCDINDTAVLEAKLNDKHYDCVVDFLVYNKNQLNRSLDVLTKYADQYIFISSTSVYNTNYDVVFEEDSEKVQQSWQYSINKYECEKQVESFCKAKNINYTIVRPGVNYGNTRIPYGMYPNIGYHWTLIERIKAKKPIIIWNDGNNRHNLTRVEDFAQGMVGLIGNKQAYGEAFNVVGDTIYTWRDVLDTLGSLTGTTVETINIPVSFYAERLRDPEQKDHLIGGRSWNCMTSNKKLKMIVPAFKERYTLEEGIRKTLSFYKDNNYLDGIDYDYEGTCDYIIAEYLKSQHMPSIKLGFRNYLNNTGRRKFKNHIRYLSYRYPNSKLIKLLLFTKNILKK